MAIDLNLVLLLVELLLLLPTLLLLILGRREEKGRQHLLKEITKTARMLSRQEYFNQVISGVQGATKYVMGSITGASPKSAEEDDRIQKIIEQIQRAKNREVNVQYLFPKSQDRMSLASRYRAAGAEVRYHPGLLVSDVRYMVIDHKYTVLGLPSVSGENEPTKEGYLIPSEGLAEIFLQQFESKWKSSTGHEEYLRGILTEIRSHDPKVSAQLLAAQLKVPESEITEALNRIESREEPVVRRTQD